MMKTPRLARRQRITPVSISTASSVSFTVTDCCAAGDAPGAMMSDAGTGCAGPSAFAVHFNEPSGQWASGHVCVGSGALSAPVATNVWSFAHAPRGHGTPNVTPAEVSGG